MTNIELYQLVSETLKAKPLLFVTTNTNNVINISVYASYLTIDYGKRILLETQWYKTDEQKEIKDTLVNVRKSRVVTLSVPSRNSIERVYQFSQALPKHVSEAEYFNQSTSHTYHNKRRYDVLPDAILSILCELQSEIIVPEIEAVSLLNVKPCAVRIHPDYSQMSVLQLKERVIENGIYHLGRSHRFPQSNIDGLWDIHQFKK